MSGNLSSGSRARWPLLGLLLASAVLLAHGYFFNSGSWNQNARLDAIFNFVEPGPAQWSFRIDRFVPVPEHGINTGDWNRVGEHYFANKLPGTILWGTLGYLPWYWALRSLGLDPTSPGLTSASVAPAWLPCPARVAHTVRLRERHKTLLDETALISLCSNLMTLRDRVV